MDHVAVRAQDWVSESIDGGVVSGECDAGAWGAIPQ